MVDFSPTIADFLLDDFIPLSASNPLELGRNSTFRQKPSELPVLEDPWKCSDVRLKGLTLTEKIHEELIRFCEYISPTPAENKQRGELIEKIRCLILELFPDAVLDVFGSVATRLYLPISDLDLVIFYKDADTQACLRKLADELQDRNIVSYIEPILSAKVPIVKFTDRLTGIRVDVCFNVENSRSSCSLVNKHQQEMPALRPLTLFLKYFLSFRHMNETYSGGMGSFLLQMMIVSHLQLHPFGSLKRTSTLPNRDLNLGSLLLSFFELYGKTFNYAAVGISVRNGGSYFSKVQRGFVDRMRPYLLSFENPLEPDIDMGRNSYGIMRVRRSFRWAYDRLISNLSSDSDTTTLLGQLVSVRGELFRMRHLTKPTESSDTAVIHLLSSQEDHSERDTWLNLPTSSLRGSLKQNIKQRRKVKTHKPRNDDTPSVAKRSRRKYRESKGVISNKYQQHKRSSAPVSISPTRQRPRQQQLT